MDKAVGQQDITCLIMTKVERIIEWSYKSQDIALLAFMGLGIGRSLSEVVKGRKDNCAAFSFLLLKP